MKLSEYIDKLKALQREARKRGFDPEVAISRFSDFTTELGPIWKSPGEERVEYPRFILGARIGDEIRPTEGWRQRHHESMKEEGELFVELAQGN